MGKIDDEVKEFKIRQGELEQSYKARNQLITQQQENNLVKDAFAKLEDDAIVYKLIDKVLLKQDVEDAKVNVDKRIEYITEEIKRVDGRVEETEKDMNERRSKIVELQQEMAAAQQPASA